VMAMRIVNSLGRTTIEPRSVVIIARGRGVFEVCEVQGSRASATMIPESEMCGVFRKCAFTSLAIVVAIGLVHGQKVATGAERCKPFGGEKTSWHGFVRRFTKKSRAQSLVKGRVSPC
jgi:hypothetical protein